MRVLTARCPHCDKAVDATTDKLHEPVNCPHCERPFEIEVPKAKVTEVRDVSEEKAASSGRLVQEAPERVLIEVHPAVFRKHPFSFLGCLVFVGAGLAAVIYGMGLENPLWLWGGAAAASIGAVVLLVWGMGAMYITLTVTDSRTILRKGFFSKSTTEVSHDDIRNVQVEQTFLERLLAVGDIAISSSGQDDLEIVALSMPRPEWIVRTIRDSQN